ncbi:MAG: nucleotidyltransferase family protein [Candidatus Schekmanbacteria bacterium]|nr:nucleotidyltransferase family protein [Candidatus Schekmanbacteria bacterium]
MRDQLNPIFQLLFHGAKRHWSNPMREALSQIAGGKVDWFKWLSIARYYRISPLLYFNLSRNDLLENLPLNIRQELKKDFLETHSLNLAQYHELNRLLKLFQDAGINCLVLKGAALAISLYPDIGLRPFGDIDLLLHDKDIARAEELLGGSYQRQTPDNLSALAQSCYFHYHYQRVAPPKLSIELHWRLFSPTTPLQLDLSGFWEQKQTVEAFGWSFSVPSRECLFLHLCLHFCGHYFLSWRDLWDIDWFLASDEPPLRDLERIKIPYTELSLRGSLIAEAISDARAEIASLPSVARNDINGIIEISKSLNWDRLIEIARHHQIEYRLYYPLYWAQQLLDAQPPPDVMERLQPSAGKKRIFQNIMTSHGGILKEPANRKKDLRAVIDILLLNPGQILSFYRRLCYPGIAWLTIFPDNPAEDGRLRIFLRGVRLLFYSLWRLIRAGW